MDFFKSVFSEDPSPSPPSSPASSDHEPAAGNSWATFGSSLLKTVASKSESVIGNYRRDLEDFSSGLRKETEIIREAASRAVKDLPGRLESGAAVAQTSLESVGQAIDNLGGAVSEIIIHGKDSIFNPNDVDSDAEFGETGSASGSNNDRQNLKPYSRLEAVIRAAQCDMRTYLDEPEEAGEFSEWKEGFNLDDFAVDIEDLIVENGVIGEIYDEVVPGKVDRETFWSRYFYKVHKVKKAEEARLQLVKRAIEGEEEEELSWDVEDDDEVGGENLSVIKKNDEAKDVVEVEEEEEKAGSSQAKDVEDDEVGGENLSFIKKNDEAKDVVEVEEEEEKAGSSQVDDDDQGVVDGRSEEMKSRESSEGKNDNISDFSVVSSQPSEADVGWDEIEDIGSGDEIKVPARGTSETGDLRKRLSAAEEDEDLSWDIEEEDDDIPSRS